MLDLEVLTIAGVLTWEISAATPGASLTSNRRNWVTRGSFLSNRDSWIKDSTKIEMEGEEEWVSHPVITWSSFFLSCSLSHSQVDRFLQKHPRRLRSCCARQSWRRISRMEQKLEQLSMKNERLDEQTFLKDGGEGWEESGRSNESHKECWLALAPSFAFQSPMRSYICFF